MNLWIIFVLAQVRNCKNISYDELHYMANHDHLIRTILGVTTASYFYESEPITFGYQTIIDNVGLLNDQAIKEINDVIIDFGNSVFKKKETEALCLKTDSFVVESNVHFPTDYNLLWDCIRKSLDMIGQLKQMRQLPGWRKSKDWRRDLKNKMRALGRASSSGGKNKKERVIEIASEYLNKSKSLYFKLLETKKSIIMPSPKEVLIIVELKKYMEFMLRHIDLVERRLINGETIAHDDKMFSIFEEYTEWIQKGKLRPNVELGKKVAITTNQHHLIINCKIMDKQSDSEIIEQIYQDLPNNRQIASWSFDKGFWSKDNNAFLSSRVDLIVLPKKGKCNNEEYEREHTPKFKKYRNLHSAVESNINELEHRGLNRCPDKGFSNFKRYVWIAVTSYNLKKIGEHLLEEQRKAQKKVFFRKSA